MKYFFQDDSDLEVKLKNRQKLHFDMGVTSQPLVAVIGIDVQTQVLVVVEDIKYQASTVMRGVDLLFKISMALDCEYSTEIKNVLLFIQRYFYKISTDHDKMSPCISTFMNKLKGNQ